MDSAILPPGSFCWVVLRNRKSILVKVLCENTALSESNHWRVCNDSELWKDIWGQRHFIHSFWWKQNYRKLFPLFLSLWGHSKASRASAECTTALLEVLFRGVWFWGSLKVTSQDSRAHLLIRQIGKVLRYNQYFLCQWLICWDFRQNCLFLHYLWKPN